MCCVAYKCEHETTHALRFLVDWIQLPPGDGCLSCCLFYVVNDDIKENFPVFFHVSWITPKIVTHNGFKRKMLLVYSEPPEGIHYWCHVKTSQQCQTTMNARESVELIRCCVPLIRCPRRKCLAVECRMKCMQNQIWTCIELWIIVS